MKLWFLIIGFLAGCISVYAQRLTDSILSVVNLQEVSISIRKDIDHNQQVKPLASVDEYLQNAEKVAMIKRGNYAWEPVINTMTTERISVTIDGMKIFHACTDRMDPVSSYVETINLKKVSLGSGFEGNPNASNNIGGSLDLKLNKSGFCLDGLNAVVSSGYETNGTLRAVGAEVSYAKPRFYINSGVFHRQSDNYRAGGDKEVRYSQFTKNNIFTNLGYVLANGKALEGTFIYDRATDVGYPALTMDVKKAEGLITSLSYTVEDPFRLFRRWETKVYYNNIVHVMDDTKRPDVPMHMDMPGKSSTGGFYSTLDGQNGKHRYSFNWDAYANRSYAEMTMYSSNQSELPMFMLTWPDVRTYNSGLFALDEYMLNYNHSVRLSAKVSLQRDGLQSDFGLKTLRIYYPGMERYRNRLIGNVSTSYSYRENGWELKTGAGFGSRAPSVSEAYGFYLFNTFDAYDYLGNPKLKNESSTELNVSARWKNDRFEVKTDVSGFFFNNYILGSPSALFSMTAGASGVKIYENLKHATLLNSNTFLQYKFLNNITWSGKIAYALGDDDKGGHLPLIAPLNYTSSLTFSKERFNADAGIAGAARQIRFNRDYGEDETPEYLIANLSAGYRFKIERVIFNLKAGVENLFNKNYSTYADWRNIPRKGRNLFINLSLNF
jgi:iron complex outermembrane recepter protein